MKQIISLFPSHIYHSQLIKKNTILMKSLIHHVQDILEKDFKGHNWSQKAYRNGYTSYASYDQLHFLASPFKSLQNKIDAAVADYLKGAFLDLSIEDLFMSRLWVNVMPSHCYHSWHIHPLSVISGTFYLQVPKSGAPIRFEDPRLNQFMNRPSVIKNSPLNDNFFSLSPKEGDLILFESWMRHEVPSHSSKDLRVSLSFNYDRTLK